MFIPFLMKIDGLGRKVPKTTGASNHTFKNRGCYSTHSKHTNDGPVRSIIEEIVAKHGNDKKKTGMY